MNDLDPATIYFLGMIACLLVVAFVVWVGKLTEEDETERWSWSEFKDES